MSDQSSRTIFDEYYYATGCGRPYGRDPAWLDFFDKVGARIQSTIQPASVLDAGCAWGLLVEALRRRDVDAFGVDVSEFAVQKAHPDVRRFCWVGSLAEPLPGAYDLVVCIEVLEHMPPEQAGQAIGNLCSISRDILFSSTPFDYKEATHFNVRPPEYWAEAFARQGYFRDVDYDASFITPWAVRYRRRDEPLARIVREYERRYFELWKENVDLRQLAAENRDTLSEYYQRLAQAEQGSTLAHQELESIRGSRSWKLGRSLAEMRLRLAPNGSRRAHLLKKVGLL
jgi:hypothetical protein